MTSFSFEKQYTKFEKSDVADSSRIAVAVTCGVARVASAQILEIN